MLLIKDHGLEDQNDKGNLNQKNPKARVEVSSLHLPGDMELFFNVDQEADEGDCVEVLGKMRFFFLRQIGVVFIFLRSFFVSMGVVAAFSS